MSENFSHPVKAETVAVMHFANKANAEVHRSECAHQSKAEWVGKPQSGAALVEQTITLYVDDYFHVAPCARRAN